MPVFLVPKYIVSCIAPSHSLGKVLAQTITNIRKCLEIKFTCGATTSIQKPSSLCPWPSVPPLRLLHLPSMSLLAHFRLEQGIGGGMPSHSRHQGGLYSSSPLHFPSSSPTSFRHGAQPPPQYTPSRSLRRSRSSSGGTDMSQQRFMKRKRLFVTDVCRDNQLEDNALDNFAKVSVFCSVLIY